MTDHVTEIRERWEYLGDVPIRGQLDYARLGECYMTDVGDLLAALESERERLLALTYASDDGSEYEHHHSIGNGHDRCPACWAEDIRNALESGVVREVRDDV